MCNGDRYVRFRTEQSKPCFLCKSGRHHSNKDCPKREPRALSNYEFRFTKRQEICKRCGKSECPSVRGGTSATRNRGWPFTSNGGLIKLMSSERQKGGRAAAAEKSRPERKVEKVDNEAAEDQKEAATAGAVSAVGAAGDDQGMPSQANEVAVDLKALMACLVGSCSTSVDGVASGAGEERDSRACDGHCRHSCVRRRSESPLAGLATKSSSGQTRNTNVSTRSLAAEVWKAVGAVTEHLKESDAAWWRMPEWCRGP